MIADFLKGATIGVTAWPALGDLKKPSPKHSYVLLESNSRIVFIIVH